MQRIAIFASGAGSNAEKIIQHFAGEKIPDIEVALIVCNKPGAGVLYVAEKYKISTLVIEREKFLGGHAYLEDLKQKKIGFIVLAGFLWKIPDELIKAYPHRIVNIHPALLPKYGGKNMYGERVHQAVIDNKEKESGITIHYVDEHYDNGDIIFQAVCPVMDGDTAASLARRIQLLEHAHYPSVIERIVTGLKDEGTQ